MRTGARVLVAEDDPMQARLIKVYLEQQGHAVMVVADGRHAVELARGRRPDLLVLDVMMPGMDGLDVCRVLRAESDVPILLLTARSTENDQLLGLDLGADDYLTKPYSPRVLMARVRALLRRAGHTGDGEPVLVRGELEVDPNRFEVRLRGRRIELTAKEFGILQTLAAEPERVFTRAQILDQAFGFDHHVLERTVDAHVVNLRRKLDDPDLVHTVYGRGYRLGS